MTTILRTLDELHHHSSSHKRLVYKVRHRCAVVVVGFQQDSDLVSKLLSCPRQVRTLLAGTFPFQSLELLKQIGPRQWKRRSVATCPHAVTSHMCLDVELVFVAMFQLQRAAYHGRDAHARAHHFNHCGAVDVDFSRRVEYHHVVGQGSRGHRRHFSFQVRLAFQTQGQVAFTTDTLGLLANLIFAFLVLGTGNQA